MHYLIGTLTTYSDGAYILMEVCNYRPQHELWTPKIVA